MSTDMDNLTIDQLKELIIIKQQQLEKLQESNRIVKEALEFVVKNSGLSADYNKVAREALKKDEEV